MTSQPNANPAKRDTARAIVIHEGQVLMMERERPDEKGGVFRYVSIPGGGIETGETPEQTAIREIMEEMNIVITLGPLVAVTTSREGNSHHYFIGHYVTGEPMLDPASPEAQEAANGNYFMPRWYPLSDLETAPLHPVYWPVRSLIEDIAAGKIPEQPWRISENTV